MLDLIDKLDLWKGLRLLVHLCPLLAVVVLLLVEVVMGWREEEPSTAVVWFWDPHRYSMIV